MVMIIVVEMVFMIVLIVVVVVVLNTSPPPNIPTMGKLVLDYVYVPALGCKWFTLRVSKIESQTWTSDAEWQLLLQMRWSRSRRASNVSCITAPSSLVGL